MLTTEEVTAIREKMKSEFVFAANFARELNVSRQAVHNVLMQKNSSADIEKALRNFLHGERKYHY